MTDLDNVFKRMLTDKYYSSKELLYDSKIGFLLSRFDYQKFLSYKDDLIKNNSPFISYISLKPFNDGVLHFSHSSDLLFLNNQYLKMMLDDLKEFKPNILVKNMDEVTRSRIYSEVEGTLNIESVPTTRKAIDDFAKGKRKPQSLNDQIIKNMIDGINFVNTLPEFNKDNLFKLYNILSNQCLAEENKLHPGDYYRYDGVEVGGYHGCPVSQINECMDSLFSLVDKVLRDRANDLKYVIPHIAHYYLLYIHPYFDYNGRTARMVSYWIMLLTKIKGFTPIVSEAINQTKNDYYYALSETRDSHNDLTYFLLYIYDISIKYLLTYKNIEEIDITLQNKGITLTTLEKTYIKKIIISSKGNFSYSDFVKWVAIDMSKQGALKILNNFERFGILCSSLSKSNKKLFFLNKSLLKYSSF